MTVVKESFLVLPAAGLVLLQHTATQEPKKGKGLQSAAAVTGLRNSQLGKTSQKMKAMPPTSGIYGMMNSQPLLSHWLAMVVLADAFATR